MTEIKEFYASGQLEWCYTKNDRNLLHGEYNGWWPNGKLCRSTWYKDGQYHGEYKLWHKDGEPGLHNFYSKGKDITAEIKQLDLTNPDTIFMIKLKWGIDIWKK